MIINFKTIILYSVHSTRFMKYEFSVEMWFVKTSARIVKYESQVFKSNPGYIMLQNIFIFI